MKLHEEAVILGSSGDHPGTVPVERVAVAVSTVDEGLEGSDVAGDLKM